MSVFQPFTLYGYEIEIPSRNDFRLFVHEAYQIDTEEIPFEIRCILPQFDDKIDSCVEYYDDSAILVIGFRPDDSLERCAELLRELDTFILDSDDLIMFSISSTPKFYTGIEWYNEPDDSESFSESDSENSYVETESSYDETSEESDTNESE